MKYKVLFICLGNICRSPAAESIFREMVDKAGLSDKIEVDSAGTYSGHVGDHSDPRMISAAMQRGYSMTHITRMICEQDFYNFDRIITMDDSNYERVCRLAPNRDYINKIFRIKEFFTTYARDWSYVPDPYYEGTEGFYLVLNMLEEACKNLLGDIVKQQEF